jgi:hypothetical protein
MLLTLALLFIFFGCVAALYIEGTWSNAVRLVNVVTAGLLAFNFFEPLAGWLSGMAPSFTYFWDFLSLWLLFAAFMIVFRVATDLLSRVKVRFLKIADRIGSGVFAVAVGWVMVCFTAATLHTAPLARNFLRGSFQPQNTTFVGVLPAPDRVWLAFVQKVSRGQFGRAQSSQELAKNEYGAVDDETDEVRKMAEFDRQSEFVLKYRQRRANLQSHADASGAVRVRPEQFNEHY